MYFNIPLDTALIKPHMTEQHVLRYSKVIRSSPSSSHIVTHKVTIIARMAARAICATNTAIRSFRENGCSGGAVQMEYNG